MEKKKIVKYAAAGLLTTSLVIGVGLHLFDSNIDHLNEYCPLNSILGVEHQIHKINYDYSVYGINAYYENETTSIEYINPTTIQKEDGSTIYTLPAGYTLVNGVGVRIVHKPERIVITQGTPVFPEGSQPGDIVKRSDIEIVNSEDIYAIPVPTRSK